MPRKRTGQNRLGCLIWLVPACLIVVVGVILLAPAIPGLLLQVVGFSPRGSVNDYWVELSTEMALEPTDAGMPGAPSGDPAAWFTSSSEPDSLQISAAGQSVSMTGSEAYADTLQFGTGVDGRPLGVIEYREDALGLICGAWLNGCRAEGFSVNSIDFHPNGAVIYGSANALGITQQAGIVLVLEPDSLSFRAAGVVSDGMVYAVPGGGEVATMVSRVVSRVNSALQGLSVQVEGTLHYPTQIYLSDESLTVVFR